MLPLQPVRRENFWGSLREARRLPAEPIPDAVQSILVVTGRYLDFIELRSAAWMDSV
jgi:hypothetical protein